MARMQETRDESPDLLSFSPIAFPSPAIDENEVGSLMDVLGRGLISAATAGEVADLVVDLVITRTGAECCRLDQVSDPEACEFRTLSARSASGLVPEIDEKIAVWVIRTGQVLRHGAPADAGEHRAHGSDGIPELPVNHLRVRSLLSLPVKSGDRVTAVLTLSSPDENVFSEKDEARLAAAAALAGDALDRVRRSEEFFDADVVNTASDLTDYKNRLAAAERLATVGGLLAGIVHELNSPLTGILGFAQLLARTEGRSDALDKIVQESERCARIVQNVLRVSGSGPLGGRECIDVNGGIRQAVELASFQLKLNRITLDVDLSPREPKIDANPGEFIQVILNLLTNAIQAILNDGDRGVIDVRSRVEDDGVLVTVRDDGPGIDPVNVQRIFEPFFTTKRAGTGLGLSLSKQIVEQNGGTVRVESRLGKGTTFSVRFPLGAPLDVPESETDHTRILVVDDESRILELMEAVLSRPGFEVECVESGDEAVGKLAEANYDLLISDMRMPGMDGSELVNWVRANGAVDNVLLLTGDIANRDLNGIAKDLGVECLRKPFRIEELLSAVDQILETENSRCRPN